MSNRKLAKRAVMCFAVLGLGAAASDGALIALYDFNAADAGTNFKDVGSKDSDTLSTAGDLGPGAGVPWNTTDAVGTSAQANGTWILVTGTPVSKFLCVHAMDTLTTTKTAAIDAGDYLSFTITPASGHEIDLTTLTMDWATNNAGGGANSYFVRVGSFDTDPVTFTRLTTFSNKSFDLSGAATITEATEIRLYIWGAPSSTTRFAEFDNLTLNGDVTPIPEPSTFAALGVLGLSGVLGRRRRA